VFVRLGKIFVVFSLIATLGAQWALLQTVAWTTMLADNLRTHSFSEAVTHTFDGKYPCPLCKAIAAGKKSQQKSEFTFQLQKSEFPIAKESFVFIAPSRFEVFPTANSFAESRSQKPLLQPPRLCFV
jgi:hypothetical protein